MVEHNLAKIGRSCGVGYAVFHMDFQDTSFGCFASSRPLKVQQQITDPFIAMYGSKKLFLGDLKAC